MVIDCESIGLHGETFAVGWVVVDEQGDEIENGYEACPPETAEGRDEDRFWVEQNVVPQQLLPPNHSNPFSVREAFWFSWRGQQEILNREEDTLILVADCLWPVEARFFRDCVADCPAVRNWDGPYPFHEVATMFLAAGWSPTATYDRLPNEEPAHHPTCDARQSARLFLEAKQEVDKR